MAVTQALIDELAKPQYAGISSNGCFELLKAQKVKMVDRLLPDVVPEITEILGDGLRDQLDTFVPKDSPLPLAAQQAILQKLRAGFEPSYLNSDRFVIHLGLPEHEQALDAAVAVGIITEAWRNKFLKLATREFAVWPDLTLRDVVEVREPARVNVGDFVKAAGNGRTAILLNLQVSLPERSGVLVEVRESADGVNWTQWQLDKRFFVHEAGLYKCDLNIRGLQYREYRCRGEFYAVAGNFEAV
jgi:hypothetical protein